MTNEQFLAGVAESANLSPTFINWFSDNPVACLKELYRFWALKEKIIDTLEWAENEMTHSQDETACCYIWCEACKESKKRWRKAHDTETNLVTNLLEDIEIAKFTKESLFD